MLHAYLYQNTFRLQTQQALPLGRAAPKGLRGLTHHYLSIVSHTVYTHNDKTHAIRRAFSLSIKSVMRFGDA